MREVGEQLASLLGLLVVFAHDSANRHLQHEVLAPRAMHTAAFAMSAALRLEMMLEPIVDERRHASVGTHDDIATVTPVTAIGTALGNMRLASERHASSAAIATLHVNVNFIYKHDVDSKRKAPPEHQRALERTVSQKPRLRLGFL